MGTIQLAVPDWDNGAEEYARKVASFCGLQHILVVRGFDHEPIVLNQMIDQCTTDYLWILTDDEIVNPKTPYLLAEYLDRHPEVGVAVPDREEESPRPPEQWYLADNTAIMYRVKVGARFDEEFFFTGYNDLDFGEEVMYRGYEVHLPHNVSVRKEPTPYGSFSNFRVAYNARNRLLFEAKWYWIGRDEWQGVDNYNQKCRQSRRIPTMFELAWWSDDVLMRFAESVEMEHPQILIKDGQDAGNVDWEFSA